jgi:hypothetical protein
LTPRSESANESRFADNQPTVQESNNGFVKVDDDDLPF